VKTYHFIFNPEEGADTRLNVVKTQKTTVNIFTALQTSNFIFKPGSIRNYDSDTEDL